MATVYETVANILIAAQYNKPAVFEQLANYVLTGLGNNAAGDANTPKYVDMSPTYNIPFYAGAFTFFGVTTPAGIEKVGNIALTSP